jgi:APA family basic amino acid/polyamine antiporter
VTAATPSATPSAAPPVPPVPPVTNALRRALGVGFGIAVAVGSMIGAGILRAPADVAARLPIPALFLGAWVLGGLYALLGANAVAELGAMLPRSGGQYVFVQRAMGRYAGFVVGWNDWLSTCGAVAAVAIVVGEAVGTLVPGLRGQAVTVATAAIAAVGVVLLRGVRESDRTQRLTSALKATALLALVVACLGAPVWGREAEAAAAPLAPVVVPTGLALGAALVVALQGIIYAYDGWTGVIYFSEEVHDPGREIPRALFGGVLSVTLLYLLLNAAFLVALPLAAIAASPLAATSAASVVFGPRGGTVVTVVVLLALPSAIVANTLMASRVAFALGRDGAAPGFLSNVNAGGTPAGALLATMVTSALFLLTGTFERVVAVCAFLFVASYALSFASVFVLRRREPLLPRPYRAWGHPWSTGLVLAGSLAFLAGTVAADPGTGLVALVLVALSWPVHRLALAGRRARASGPPRPPA